MKIIGIGYKKRSGKSTLAEFIKEHYPGIVVIRSFADELKYEVALALGIPVKTIEDNKAVFRPILQWWGTEYRRKFQNNDNYWINKLHEKYINCRADIDLLIIPDVRFYNEAAFVKEQGGMLVTVLRSKDGPQTPEDQHSSETELDNFSSWDAVIYNSGTLDTLEAWAKYIINSLKAPNLT